MKNIIEKIIDFLGIIIGGGIVLIPVALIIYFILKIAHFD